MFVGCYLVRRQQLQPDWLAASYQGDSASNLNEVYGMKWTLSSLIKAVAVVGFNLALGNMVELAGLATVVWAMLTGGTLEFVPQWLQIVLGLVVVPLVVVFHVIVAFHALRHLFVVARSPPAVRVDTCIRRLQLPMAGGRRHLLAADHSGHVAAVPDVAGLCAETSRALRPRRPHTAPACATMSCRRSCVLLLAVNTFNAVVPVSSSNFARYQATHAAMLRTGDLEIFPVGISRSGRCPTRTRRGFSSYC